MRIGHGHNCGSPPRVWGILVRIDRGRESCRFTPRCGEYSGSSAHVATSGSPPRVWGILACPRLSDVTRCGSPPPCGEYVSLGRSWSFVAPGSPPRVWGIHMIRNFYTGSLSVHPHACGEYRSAYRTPMRLIRFTPTRMGNTRWRLASTAQLAVHPHTCGEYLAIGRAIGRDAGSPPRVWGIHDRCDCAIGSPTRVGNTPSIRACGSPPRVWGIPAAVI